MDDFSPPSPDVAPEPFPGDDDTVRRRSQPRVRVEWPITISLPEGYFQANLRDVSPAGVCFHLDRQVPEMSILSLQLDLPAPSGPRRIQGRGAVVRCVRVAPALDHYEVAVFFHELADEDREALSRFVMDQER